MAIKLPPEIEQHLDALVEQIRCSKGELLLHAVENGLYDVRDYYEALATLERIRRGEERTYTSAEVSAYLGLDRIPMAMKPKRTLRDAFFNSGLPGILGKFLCGAMAFRRK